MKSLAIIMAHALIFAIGGASMESYIGEGRPELFAFFGYCVGVSMTTTLIVVGKYR